MLPPIWEAGSLLYDAATYNPPTPRVTPANYLYNPDGSPRLNGDGTPRSPADIPDFPYLNMNSGSSDSGSGSSTADGDTSMGQDKKRPKRK